MHIVKEKCIKINKSENIYSEIQQKRLKSSYNNTKKSRLTSTSTLTLPKNYLKVNNRQCK